MCKVRTRMDGDATFGGTRPPRDLRMRVGCMVAVVLENMC